MNIAWIDDDTEIIDPVVKPLVEAGHDIHRYRTIRQAIDGLPTIRTCDLIILDVIIPPGDSFENIPHYSGPWLLAKLRHEHQLQTPVIIFSVVDPEKLSAELDPLKISAYVRKPALPSELKGKVDEVLSAQEESGAGA